LLAYITAQDTVNQSTAIYQFIQKKMNILRLRKEQLFLGVYSAWWRHQKYKKETDVLF
jgi:hypothetical protein